MEMKTHAFFESSAGLTPIFASRSSPPFAITQWQRLLIVPMISSLPSNLSSASKVEKNALLTLRRSQPLEQHLLRVAQQRVTQLVLGLPVRLLRRLVAREAEDGVPEGGEGGRGIAEGAGLGGATCRRGTRKMMEEEGGREGRQEGSQ